MNYGDFIDWVGRTTKRPDKDQEIRDAINGAISLAAAKGQFSADLVESSVALDATLYSQAIVISTTFPRFRKVKYLRPQGYSRYINWQDSARIFGADGKECVDVWYRAGDNIVFKLANLQSIMLYGYYAYHALLNALTDADWMLDAMGSYVHQQACAQVFDEIGDKESAARYDARSLRLLDTHIADLQHGNAFV